MLLACDVPCLGQSFSGKNLGGFPILDETETPLSRTNGRVELVWKTKVFASGGFIRDGFFALGTVSPDPGLDFIPTRILVRCWDASVAASFDEAVRAGHGFAATSVNVPLSTPGAPPVDLSAAGFLGMSLVTRDAVPYWIRNEQSVPLQPTSPPGSVGYLVNNLIASPSYIQSFRFETSVPGEFTLNLLHLTTLDPLIRIFDATGTELALSDSLPDSLLTGGNPTNQFLRLRLDTPGVYHLAISAKSNRSYPLFRNESVVPGTVFGDFNLAVAVGIHGIVRAPLPLDEGFKIADRPVDLLPFAGGLTHTNWPNTWLLIPGWNGSPSDPALLDLATNLTRLRPLDAVLILDWSTMARTPWSDPYSPAAAIRPVAGWAAAALGQLGLRGGSLNLIGHSFGAYIADEIAKGMEGGVNSLVALDPSANVAPVQFDPLKDGEIQFRRHARLSWAIHASLSGSEVTPTTANEAYILDAGKSTTAVSPETFRVMRDLFNGVYRAQGRAGGLVNLFVPDRLVDALPLSLLPDQFSTYFPVEAGTPGYEGILGSPNLGPSVAIHLVPSVTLRVERTRTGLSLVVGKASWGGWLWYSKDLVHWSQGDNLPSTEYGEQRIRIPDGQDAAVYYRVE